MTPFHARTSALNSGQAWKEWAGKLAASNFDRHSEREYFSFRHTAGLLDVSPLYKIDVTGPDAAAFLGMLFTRDIEKMTPGQVVYGCLCDHSGNTLDDGTVSRIGRDLYRLTSSEPWLHWLHDHARGFSVNIVDTTDEIAALALQGPRARAILNSAVDFDLDKMRFFRVRPMKLNGHDVVVSRTGYTGDLGYEIWMANDSALPVWDAIVEAGHPHGLEVVGLDALDVTRIEAGFVLQGVDYKTSRACVSEFQKMTPFEIGLGKTVDFKDREAFIGQARLQEQAEKGTDWDLVGIEVDWAAIEALHEEEGIPPHLAPVACRNPAGLFDYSGETQVGQVTSSVWSPLLKRYIALATVQKGSAALGTDLRMQYTVDFWRRDVECSVVERPFFDPERKTSTPGRER